jgi:hypothetical protein
MDLHTLQAVSLWYERQGQKIPVAFLEYQQSVHVSLFGGGRMRSCAVFLLAGGFRARWRDWVRCWLILLTKEGDSGD